MPISQRLPFERHGTRIFHLELDGGPKDITGVNNTVKRGTLELSERIYRGIVTNLIIVAKNKSGLAPTAVDIRILMDDSASEVIDSGTTFIRKLALVLTGADPEEVFNGEMLAGFTTEGTEGILGVHILHTGGDGTTNIDYEFRLYGDAHN